MEKLERVYNKSMRALNILTYSDVKKTVKNLYEDFKEIPEDQLYKISTKFIWDKNTSLIGNIQILLDRNICEYVAKKYHYINKNYTFKDGGIDENEEYMIKLNSPEDATQDVKDDIEYNGNIFHVIYKIVPNID